jgi:hypothetical protein
MFSTAKNLARAGVVCSLLPLIAACATSGPTFQAAHTAEPPVAQDQARIYFYRLGNFVGSAIQPAVKVNGVKIGDAVPGGYFFVDEPAGTYEISTSTETKEAITTTIKPGETRYVRFDVSMGVLVGHVAPTLVWPDQGAAEIQALHYVGAKTVSAP